MTAVRAAAILCGRDTQPRPADKHLPLLSNGATKRARRSWPASSAPHEISWDAFGPSAESVRAAGSRSGRRSLATRCARPTRKHCAGQARNSRRHCLCLVAGSGSGKVEFAFDDHNPMLVHGSYQGLSRQRQRDAGRRGKGFLGHAAPRLRARRTAIGSRSRDGGVTGRCRPQAAVQFERTTALE